MTSGDVSHAGPSLVGSRRGYQWRDALGLLTANPVNYSAYEAATRTRAVVQVPLVRGREKVDSVRNPPDPPDSVLLVVAALVMISVSCIAEIH